jgi:pyruvate/2-oxoglutarate dehydrogenase complex dihydrolipoamide acyltransferase (E2) component
VERTTATPRNQVAQRRAPSARRPIGGAEAVLALQASAGNQAVARALAARSGATLARCSGGTCTCGGACGKQEELLEESDFKPRRAVLTPLRRGAPVLARCAGRCTCGGSCRGTEELLEGEHARALITRSPSRLPHRPRGRSPPQALIQRDLVDDVIGGADELIKEGKNIVDEGQKTVADVCQRLNNLGTGAPTPCAKNPKCPPAYCAPLPSMLEAIAIRNLIRVPMLAAIGAKVNARVVPFWDTYLGSGFSVGGDSTVRDLSARFGSEFTSSQTTLDTTDFILRELKASLQANPPAVAVGATETIDIPSRIPSAVAAINDPGSNDKMDFDIPTETPGNLVGGIGLNEASCRVGAKPSPQDDARLIRGTAQVTRNADGSLTAVPDITYEVHDTIDLCPGDCGALLERCATFILSRLEATGVSGDMPLKATFPAPSRPAIHIPSAAPKPTPPKPTPPKPKPTPPKPKPTPKPKPKPKPTPKPPTPNVKKQLTSPRFLGPDGQPLEKLEACFENRSRLAEGSRGAPVAAVQQALIDLGYDLGPMGADGIFGRYTAAAVKAFKHDEQLGYEQYSDVGPRTMARLDELFPPIF